MSYKGRLKKMASSPGAKLAMQGSGVVTGAFAGGMLNLANDKIDFLKENKLVLPLIKVAAGIGIAYAGRENEFIKNSGFGLSASGGHDLGVMAAEKIKEMMSDDDDSKTSTKNTTTETEEEKVNGIGNTANLVIDEDLLPINDSDVSGTNYDNSITGTAADNNIV
jgi:hypothetical protein